MDWIQHPDRRQSADRRQGYRGPGGAERRAPDLIERPPGRNTGIEEPQLDPRRTDGDGQEMPPNPTAGDAGPDARHQLDIERGRSSERERSVERERTSGEYRRSGK
jgi:hypothetical protein